MSRVNAAELFATPIPILSVFVASLLGEAKQLAFYADGSLGYL